MCIASQTAELQRMVGEMVKETNGEDPTSSSKRESAGGNALSKHVDSERPISVDAFTSVVMAHGFNSVTSTAFKDRYTDLARGFKFMDLDRNGKLSHSEVEHALRMWNVSATHCPADAPVLALCTVQR